MLFLTTYTLKPHMTKAETKALMDTFATAGSAPGTIAHYVSADGGGGVVISEADDAAANYRNTLNYNQWMTLESRVVLNIDDAVPQIADYLG